MMTSTCKNVTGVRHIKSPGLVQLRRIHFSAALPAGPSPPPPPPPIFEEWIYADEPGSTAGGSPTNIQTPEGDVS